MSIYGEIQKLNPSALIDLYVLDLTKEGGPMYYFHPGTNEFNQDLIWQGITYIRLPITVSGFEKRQNGALPRPLVQLSNIAGSLAAQSKLYNYFLGCKLIRKRTFARFLDASNFIAGNPNADQYQYLPDEIWFINRKSNENATIIEFELASSLELQGVALPRRQFIQNVCTAVYRSPQCSYSGGPVATDADVPTSDMAKDQCSKKLSGCKLRFGTGILPYAGFPGAGLVA
jgi:lambda family phage minor tail protein L